MIAPAPLLLIPGLLCDRRVFAPQIAALSARAGAVVADVAGGDSIAALAAAALERAPQRFALCGLSMGGYVCFEILRRAPERVTRLARIGANAHADSEAARASRRGLLALAAGGDFPAAVEQLLPRLVHPDRLSDPAVAGVFRAMAAATGPAAFARQQRAIMERCDSRGDLGRIGCPTLVLCGREDALMPVASHVEMATAIPDATLVALPHCGHLATIERPGPVVAQLSAWLAGEAPPDR